MSSNYAIAACAFAQLLMMGEAQSQAALSVPAGLPAWAFNIPDKIQPPAVKPQGIVTVPNSTRRYEAAQIAGNAYTADWFPNEHPPAPKVVTGGGGVRFACGSCHLMSGQGHPESADLAGLPAAYIVQQMADYKSCARTRSVWARSQRYFPTRRSERQLITSPRSSLLCL